MRNGQITKIGLRNFKSFGSEYQELDIRPLTILIGRNSSGKSSIIQSLLLLKQTLDDPRPEVQLNTVGYVDAIGLRELTHGWPAKGGAQVNWPEFTIEWNSTFFGTLPLEQRGVSKWILKEATHNYRKQITKIVIKFSEDNNQIRVLNIVLSGRSANMLLPSITISWDPSRRDYILKTDAQDFPEGPIASRWDHFLPTWFLFSPKTGSPRKEDVLRRLYADSLDALKDILRQFKYLGGARTIPPSIYRAPTSPIEDVGVSGEYAAQLLYGRQTESVHWLPLAQVDPTGGPVELPNKLKSAPLIKAVNEIIKQLGIKEQFELHDIQELGFRLLCGQASLQHVGRGVGFLLPVITAGLITDPLIGKQLGANIDLPTYLRRCEFTSHLAMEELETHIHPKVQTRLAHFLVSLARSGRQVIIETHSDHLVRRLRGLIARAKPGSESEIWLKNNINLVQVEQNDQGVTKLTQSYLNEQGNIVNCWPAEFMDESPNEEQSIYFASMSKSVPSEILAEKEYLKNTKIEHKED